MLAVPNPTDTLGNLGVVITATKYTTLSGGIEFTISEDPGISPPWANTYPNRTAAKGTFFPFLVQEGMQTFYKEKQTYNKSMAIKGLDRKAINNSVDNKYTNHLRHACTTYQNVDPITVLAHLWTTYGDLDKANMPANKRRICTA